jgi:hypothetical protein
MEIALRLKSEPTQTEDLHVEAYSLSQPVVAVVDAVLMGQFEEAD